MAPKMTTILGAVFQGVAISQSAGLSRILQEKLVFEHVLQN